METIYINCPLPIFLFELEDDLIQKILRLVNSAEITNPENLLYLKDKNYVKSINQDTDIYNLIKHKNNYSFILDVITQKIKEVSSTFYGRKNFNFFCTEIVHTKFSEGGFVKKHCHFPNLFTATIYLKVDNENSSNIIFEGNTEVPVKTGLVIIHPGFMSHEVKETKTKGEILFMDFIAEF